MAGCLDKEVSKLSNWKITGPTGCSGRQVSVALNKEEKMKRFVLGLSLFSALCIATVALAVVDKEAISNNVNVIVAGIESGQDVTSFKADAYDPYAFIMVDDGKMLVHPSLTGKSLQETAPPVYQALLKATPEGIWVEYEWQGKTKHTYARKTKNHLIVGSGY